MLIFTQSWMCMWKFWNSSCHFCVDLPFYGSPLLPAYASVCSFLFLLFCCFFPVESAYGIYSSLPFQTSMCQTLLLAAKLSDQTKSIFLPDFLGYKLTVSSDFSECISKKAMRNHVFAILWSSNTYWNQPATFVFIIRPLSYLITFALLSAFKPTLHFFIVYFCLNEWHGPVVLHSL